MKRKSFLSFSLVTLALSLPLIGCTGGGGGLIGFLGGASSDALGALGSFIGSDSGSDSGSGGPLFLASLTGDTTGDVTEGGSDAIKTVHNPEPMSMALFGGGLAGLAFLKRRKLRQPS